MRHQRTPWGCLQSQLHVLRLAGQRRRGHRSGGPTQGSRRPEPQGVRRLQAGRLLHPRIRAKRARRKRQKTEKKEKAACLKGRLLLITHAKVGRRSRVCPRGQGRRRPSWQHAAASIWDRRLPAMRGTGMHGVNLATPKTLAKVRTNRPKRRPGRRRLPHTRLAGRRTAPGCAATPKLLASTADALGRVGHLDLHGSWPAHCPLTRNAPGGVFLVFRCPASTVGFHALLVPQEGSPGQRDRGHAHPQEARSQALLRRSQRAGDLQEFVNLLNAHYGEAHNAAEAARRLLYAAAGSPTALASSH